MKNAKQKATSQNNGTVILTDNNAERCILAAIILRNDAMLEVTRIISPDDFYQTRHRIIYQQALELWNANERFDSVILKSALNNTGQLKQLQDPLYIDSILNEIPSSYGAVKYARTIRDLRKRRDLIQLAQSIRQDAESPQDIGLVAQNVTTQALNISQEIASRETQPLAQVMPEFAEQYFNADKRPQPRIMTGIGALDKVMKGIKTQSYCVIDAPPSVGKTALAMNIAMNVAARNLPVIFFSLEMQQNDIIHRMLANLTQRDSYLIEHGLPPQHKNELLAAIEMLKSYPLVIDDSTYQLDAIKLQARRWLHHYSDIAVIVIDYLQLIRHDAPTEYERISHISGELKLLTKETNSIVIVPSSLNREGQAKGSRNIEFDADVHMTITKPPEDTDQDKIVNLELRVVKHRSGRRGKALLKFNRPLSLIESALDIDTEQEPVIPKPQTKAHAQEENLEENFI